MIGSIQVTPNANEAAVENWKRLKPLSLQEWENHWQLAEQDGPQENFLNDGAVEYAAWEHYGKTCYGMRKKLTKKRHGIVRIVEPNGPIIEATYKDGALHGMYRRTDKDGV